MQRTKIRMLLAEIEEIGIYVSLDSPLVAPERCIVLPKLIWDAALVEKAVGMAIHPDLRTFWDATSGLYLFHDIIYGQGGLVIWSPDQTAIRHPWFRSFHPDEYYIGRERYITGDLIIGEFFGETNRLVLRCDPTASDYGAVMIADTAYPHTEWESPAPSLLDFLTRFVNAKGEPFWSH